MITLTDHEMAELHDSGQWLDARTAEAMLGVTFGTIAQWARDGALSIIAHGGLALVSRSDIYEKLAQDSHAAALNQVNIVGSFISVLNTYLSRAPLTGDLVVSREVGRPLVCARRGDAAKWRNHGLAYHSVVAPMSGIETVALEQQAAGDRNIIIPSHAALARMLVALPGVEPVSWLTPLLAPSKPVRNGSWVRLDPSHHRMLLPRELAERIGEPIDTRHTLVDEHGEAEPDPTAGLTDEELAAIFGEKYVKDMR